MSFSVETISDLSKSVRAKFRQYMPGTDASVAQNTIYVIAKVITLIAYEFLLRLKWIYNQRFLSSATDEEQIKLHAAEFGLTQKPASSAEGAVEGIGEPHRTYPAGVRFLSGNQTYVATEPFVAGALGAFTATLRSEDAGVLLNRDAGAQFNVVDTALYPSITDVFADSAGIGGGADIESVKQLQARALLYKKNPPQGGALPDYENWALEVSGVVAAWAALFENSLGHIGVWCLFSGRENGIPTNADLNLVNDYIVDKRIVRGEFSAVAPTAMSVDLAIKLSPDTVEQRAAVTTALQQFFDATQNGTRIRPGLPGNPFTLPVAWISEVISSVDGEFSHTLTTPETDITFDPGKLPILGSITWS